jgi:hypothetical protein
MSHAVMSSDTCRVAGETPIEADQFCPYRISEGRCWICVEHWWNGDWLGNLHHGRFINHKCTNNRIPEDEPSGLKHVEDVNINNKNINLENIYRVIHKSVRDFRNRLRNNQDRHGRKEHINR